MLTQLATLRIGFGLRTVAQIFQRIERGQQLYHRRAE